MSRTHGDGAGASAVRQADTIRRTHRQERHRLARRRAPLIAAAAAAAGGAMAAATHAPTAGAATALVVTAWCLRRTYTRSTTADRWERGARGERRTARSLDLARGWIALHDRAIPGSRANLDHLVIGPAGVLYVDTKNWTSPRSRARIEGGRLSYGRYDQTRAVASVMWEASRVQAALGVPVRAIISVHGQPHLPRAGTLVDTVTVLPAPALREWLRCQPRRHDEHQVQALAARADRAFPPYRTR
ncbi:nuclease-related domain-containing protein [Embleya sp. NPDC005971]|uniref:nuclease-related domain-containing protein n=1 Tax=Embleya sp. NPDC005971 TaxID=3156724 RepID=UPI003402F20E